MSDPRAAVNYLKKGMRTGGIIGGLTGAASGAVLGSKKHNIDGTKRTGKERLVWAGLGAASFGLAGHQLGSFAGVAKNYSNLKGGFIPPAPKPKMPAWLKGAKTRTEGHNLYRQNAKKLHPDLGGSNEAMANLSNEWKSYEPHLKKIAMLFAFADEISKIAMAI